MQKAAQREYNASVPDCLRANDLYIKNPNGRTSLVKISVPKKQAGHSGYPEEFIIPSFAQNPRIYAVFHKNIGIIFIDSAHKAS